MANFEKIVELLAIEDKIKEINCLLLYSSFCLCHDGLLRKVQEPVEDKESNRAFHGR